jgi:hypothetical protein
MKEDLKRILLYMKYDNSKTLNENRQNFLLLEENISYAGPFYPMPLAQGPIGSFGSYNYKDGKRFKTGEAGSKFTVEGSVVGSKDAVVTVLANDLGIRYTYHCKDNSDKSYAFRFKRGDIYNKEKWNKNCCAKEEDWNIEYWNDEDGTTNWSIPDLGPLLYQDYCVVKDNKVKTTTPKTTTKPKTTPKKITTPNTGWNETCQGTYSMGCKTPEVGEAQQCLKDEGLYPYTVDNKFGSKTRSAVYKKLNKSSFTDEDLKTICKTTAGGGGQDDFDSDMGSTSGDSTIDDKTWTGDVY